MLFCILLDLLQMFVIAVLSKPVNHVTVGPVDLESVRVIVIDMVLGETEFSKHDHR